VGKAVTKPKFVRPSGRAPGQKRKNFHFTGPDGSLWDSRFEYIFYTAAKEAGLPIARCTKSNTFSFILPIKSGSCGSCGATNIGQRRTLTPDFLLTADNSELPAEQAYIETKGYLRAKERSLLRALYKSHPDANISFVFQRAYPVGSKRADGTKGSVIDWFKKFMPNWSVYVWNGKVTTELLDALAGRDRRAVREETSAQSEPVHRGDREADTGAVTAAPRGARKSRKAARV
jgi:hypothetical protein